MQINLKSIIWELGWPSERTLYNVQCCDGILCNSFVVIIGSNRTLKSSMPSMIMCSDSGLFRPKTLRLSAGIAR